MDKIRILEILITQMIIVLSLVFIIISLLIVRKNNKIIKKFNNYTVKSIKRANVSFLDKLIYMMEYIISKNAEVLRKLRFMTRYAKKYDKHLTFEELKNKDGFYILSTKFMMTFFIVLLYFLNQVFRYKDITFGGIFLSGILGYFITDIFLLLNYMKKKKEIEEDLLKAIMVMNSAFKSGRSLVQAIEIVKDELTGAISDEFKKIYLDISYGLSVETVFERFYQRIKLEEAKYISSSLTLLNQTGGNITKVFESIEKEFYSRKKLDNELKSMTASSIFVFRTLLFMPFIVCLVIFILNNNYFDPLFNSGLGKIILALIGILYLIYIIIIKRIIKVEL